MQENPKEGKGFLLVGAWPKTGPGCWLGRVRRIKSGIRDDPWTVLTLEEPQPSAFLEVFPLFTSLMINYTLSLMQGLVGYDR